MSALQSLIKRIPNDLVNVLKYSDRKHRLFIFDKNNFKLTKRVLATTMKVENNKNEKFRIIDYDCIGFDLDNTVARYKIGNMLEMAYDVMVKFLSSKGTYPNDVLKQPFDHNFIIKGLMTDDDNGNLLRIGPDGTILQASHGTKMLTEDEILRYYPNKHWELTDLFVKDPLSTWNGPYAEKLRTFLDYFDVTASLIYARCVDYIDKKEGGPQKHYEVWPDLVEALQDMYTRENFKLNKGGYFENIKNHPEKYYYECSPNLLQWLKQLKNMGKILFLITGSHIDSASHTAYNTIGPNWREYFDIVICFAKKPGFFNQRRDFIGVDGFEETGPVKDLKIGGIYTHGNWTDLHDFFQKQFTKPNPKFIYVGDNLIQDIYTPNIFSHCETIAVCEELEAEGHDGHQKWHPDMQFLISTVWGSYFHCNNKPTCWYSIMKQHSKICIPSLEYLALLPIDQELECNKPDDYEK